MYLDSSAFLTLYLDEPDRLRCLELVSKDPLPTSAALTSIEARRRLALEGDDDGAARSAFRRDWAVVQIVRLDEVIVERAAEIAEATAARSLDAIHLAAAERCPLPILTYDRRQAQAAAALGLDLVAS